MRDLSLSHKWEIAQQDTSGVSRALERKSGYVPLNRTRSNPIHMPL